MPAVNRSTVPLLIPKALSFLSKYIFAQSTSQLCLSNTSWDSDLQQHKVAMSKQNPAIPPKTLRVKCHLCSLSTKDITKPPSPVPLPRKHACTHASVSTYMLTYAHTDALHTHTHSYRKNSLQTPEGGKRQLANVPLFLIRSLLPPSHNPILPLPSQIIALSSPLPSSSKINIFFICWFKRFFYACKQDRGREKKRREIS